MLPPSSSEASSSSLESISGQLKRKANDVFADQNGPNISFNDLEVAQAESRAGSCAETAIQLDSSDDEGGRAGVLGNVPLKTARITPPVTPTVQPNGSAGNCSPVHDQESCGTRSPEMAMSVCPSGTMAVHCDASVSAQCCSSSGSGSDSSESPSALALATDSSLPPEVAPLQQAQATIAVCSQAACAATTGSPRKKATLAPSSTPSAPTATPPTTAGPKTGISLANRTVSPNTNGGRLEDTVPSNAAQSCSPALGSGANAGTPPAPATAGAKAVRAATPSVTNGSPLQGQVSSPGKPKRKPGRPPGSKNRFRVKDPPYIAPSAQQVGGVI